MNKDYDYKHLAEYVKKNKLNLNNSEFILLEIPLEYYGSKILFWITNERIIKIYHTYCTDIETVEVNYLEIKNIEKLIITASTFYDTCNLFFVSNNNNFQDISIVDINKIFKQNIIELLKKDILIEEINPFPELQRICKTLGTKNQYDFLFIDKQNIKEYIDILIKRASYPNNSNSSIIFDCKNITDEESFWDEIQNKFTKDCDWFGRNFDAFNDALRGGCGLFENILPVNISIINIKDMIKKRKLYLMLDVMISFVYEIKSDDYSIKYIEDLKNNCDCIALEEDKFISLRLYKDEIV